MTMYMSELVRVRGNERWDEYGDDWWDHVKRIGEFRQDSIARSAGASLRQAGFKGRQLDWGAFLYELSKEELIRFVGADAELIPVAPARKRGRRWVKTVGKLRNSWRYGMVVIELW